MGDAIIQTGARQKRKRGTHFHETGEKHQCQCDIRCNSLAVDGEAFCEEHLSQCPNKSALTGLEPEYEPNRWNLNKLLRLTHNCFAYAMNIYDTKQIAKCKDKKKCDASFHQPGFASGHESFSNYAPKTCPNMMVRMFGDNPDIIMSDFTSQCPPNYSKIALIIDESDDYHFLRQDKNKYWSHKPGARRVTNLDAAGHKIWNPKLANYNYRSDKKSDLNYDIFCSYMCVPRGIPLYLKARGGGTRARRAPAPSPSTKPFRTKKTRRGSRGRR